MLTTAPIPLSFIQILVVLGVCFYVAFKGRLEWSLGIYLAFGMGGGGTFMIGPFAHTYIILATLFLSTIVYLSKKQSIKLFPPYDKWIVPWMIMWWVWVLFLIMLFKPDNKTAILMSLIPRIIAPLPIILLFAGDKNKIKGFVVTYIFASLFNGWKAVFYNYGVSPTFLSLDFSLRQIGIYFMTGQNYHWFSYPFAISLIMITALYMNLQERKTFRLILLICAINCVYFLFLAGSRQTIGGVTIVLVLMMLRTLKHTWRFSYFNAFILTVAIGLIGLYLLNLAPYLIVRTGEAGLLDAFNLIRGRASAWTGGIKAFIESPFWGTGFTYFGSHNLFIGTLAEQGIFGMGFLMGYLYFIFRRSRGVWSNKRKDDWTNLRLTFLGIILFALIHSVASGSVVSVWHLYWPVAFIWGLEYSVTEPSSILIKG